jgi:AcrR family transcriptional regulator
MTEADTVGAQGAKRRRTRARLIEAAAELIAEKGYERTSLEAVAARAGMTRGAIYGNFKNREDLFLAVAAAKWRPIVPAFEPGADFPALMRGLAEAVVAEMPARRRAAIGAASFQLHALTHAAMQQRVAAANAAIYGQMAAGLRGLFPEEAFPAPPDLFVRVAHALVDGLMFLHALTPELIDETVVRAAFMVLAQAGAARLGGARPGGSPKGGASGG